MTQKFIDLIGLGHFKTKLLELFMKKDEGAVTISAKSTPNAGFLKTYVVKQGDNSVGEIDIPKDVFLVSGEVVTNPSGQPAGTYIKLVVGTSSTDEKQTLYIDVASLIDNYTTGSAAGDPVVVNIDATTRKISATLTDGSIVKAKLETSVQTSLGKADTAYQKPTGGIPHTDLAAGVKESLDLADSALQGEDVSVTYDGTNKKLVGTVKGSSADIVTAAKVVEDGGAVTEVKYDTTAKKIQYKANGAYVDIAEVESDAKKNSTKLITSGAVYDVLKDYEENYDDLIAPLSSKTQLLAGAVSTPKASLPGNKTITVSGDYKPAIGDIMYIKLGGALGDTDNVVLDVGGKGLGPITFVGTGVCQANDVLYVAYEASDTTVINLSAAARLSATALQEADLTFATTAEIEALFD